MAEMKALEFLREWHRMCQKYPFCSDCPMEDSSSRSCMPCKWVFNDIEKVIATVKKWAKEHPRKTILQDFLEKYPNAPLSKEGIPKTCAISLGLKKETIEGCYEKECKDCWNTPVEEEVENNG